MADEIVIGPITSHREFFEKHLKQDIPELEGIKRALMTDDIAAADRIFADYVRKNPQIEKLTAGWRREVAALDEKGKEKLIARARDVMDYKFISCGIPWHFADHKVDWEFNPTYNGYKEWPWQLSRHPEWGVLAKYYLLTGDERAAETYSDMLDSWIKQAVVPENVSGYSTVCWRTIEAGIRLMSWINQISTFINSPAMTDSRITEYYISLYEHGWRLRNFCTHGNWLIMEMHGLLKAALTGYFLKDSEEWYEYSVKRLCAELDIQVYPDGFQYELSTNYHNVVDSNYLNVLVIFETLGLQPPGEILERLEKMFEMYPRLSRPNRRLPDLNDGNQMPVANKLRQAARLYPDRKDFLWFATNGAEGEFPRYRSCAFPYAGAAVMRSSWASDAIWAYMDCSPFGRGHQHEDKLNVLLDAYGKTMLTEGGVYDYDSSEMRKYVLSTRAHNTVMIDGKEQNYRPHYKWADEDINKKADFEFYTCDQYDVAHAQYTEGYGADNDDVVHDRRLIFVKDADWVRLDPFLVVIDRFIAPDGKPRKYEAAWHMEECELTLSKSYASGDFGDGVGLTLVCSDGNGSVTDMRGSYEPYYQGWFPIRPSGPHEHRPIPTPVFSGEFTGSRRIVSVLYPYRDGKNPVVGVSAGDDVSADAITLHLSDGRSVNMKESEHAPQPEEDLSFLLEQK